MSSIDRRIVEMKLDNGEFGRRTEQTVKNLQDLEKALQLDGAGKGLSDLENKVKGFSLSGIGDAVDSIASKFSVLGAVGFTAIQSLTNTVMGFGQKLISNVLDPIFSGGKRRALNIESAKFQLEGLKVAWEDVLPAINYAVLDTAYGLDEAAKAASQFAASGHRDMDKMGTYLRAISGAAAMTNSTYDDTASIFTKVAGQGRLMGDDLNRLAARGLNAAATLAESMGVSEETVRKMVSEGEISFEQFATAMDAAFGEHAKKANETMQGAFSNMKAALARIGANFYTPFHEASRDFFNTMTPIFNSVKDALDPGMTALGDWMILSVGDFTAKVKSVFTGDKENKTIAEQYFQQGIGMAPKIIENLYKAIMSWLTPIKQAFSSVFGSEQSGFQAFYIFMVKVNQFTQTLRKGFDAGNTFYRIWRGIFSAFGIGWEVAKGFFGVLKDLFGMVDRGQGGFSNFAAAVGDVVWEFYQGVKSGEKLGGVFRFLKSVLTPVVIAFNAIRKVVSAVWDVFAESGVIEYAGELFNRFFDGLNFGFDTSAGFIDGFVDYIRSMTIDIDKVKEVTEGFIETFIAGWTMVKDFVFPIFEGIVDFFKSLPEKINADDFTFKDFFGEIKISMPKQFSSFTKTVGEWFTTWWGQYGPVFASIKDGLISLWEAIQNLFGDMDWKKALAILGMGGLLGFAIKAYELLNQSRDVMKAVVGMFESIGGAFDAVKDHAKALTKSLKYDNLIRIAFAILILSGALWLISKIPEDDLWRSVGVMAAIAGIVVAIIGVVRLIELIPAKASSSFWTFIGVALGLVLVMAAIKPLGEALKQISDIPWASLRNAIVAVISVILTIGVMLVALTKVSKGLALPALASAAAIALVLWSLEPLGQALAMISSIQTDNLEQAIRGIIEPIIVIGILLTVLTEIGKKNPLATIASAGAIALVLWSLVPLGEALGVIGAMDQGSWGRGLGGMVLALGSVGLIVGLLGGLAPWSILGAGAIALVSVTLPEMAEGLDKLGQMSWSSIEEGLKAMDAALLIIAGGSLLNTFGILGGITIALVAGNLEKLATGIKAFDGVTVPPGLSEAMTAIADGVKAQSMWFSQGYNFNQVAQNLGAMADGVRKWEGVSIHPGMTDAVSALGTAVKEFPTNIFQGNNFVKVGENIGSMGDGIRKWEGISIHPGMTAAVSALGTAVKEFPTNIFQGNNFVKVGENIGSMGDGVRKWEGISIHAGMASTVSELGKALVDWPWNILKSATMAAAVTPIGDMAGAMQKWNGVSIPAGIGTVLGELGAGLKEFPWTSFSLENMTAIIGPLGELSGSVNSWAGAPRDYPFETVLTSISNGVSALAYVDPGNFALIVPWVGFLAEAVSAWSGIMLVGDPFTFLDSLARGITALINVGDFSGLSTSLDSVSASITSVLEGAVLAASNSGLKTAQAYAVGINSGSWMVTIAGILLVLSFANTIATSAVFATASGVLVANSFGAGLIQQVNPIRLLASVIFATVLTALTKDKSKIVDAGKSIGSSFTLAVSSSVGSLSYLVVASANSIGVQIANGMARGITSNTPVIESAARRAATKALNAAKNTLDVRSPSRRAEKELGLQFDLGWAKGIDGGVKHIVSSVRNAASSSLTALDASYSDPSISLFDDLTPVISPVLDLTDVERQAGRLGRYFNDVNGSVSLQAGHAATLSAGQSNATGLIGDAASGSTQYTYTQTINSPKAVSNAEIFRKTKTLLAVKKQQSGER